MADENKKYVHAYRIGNKGAYKIAYLDQWLYYSRSEKKAMSGAKEEIKECYSPNKIPSDLEIIIIDISSVNEKKVINLVEDK